MLGVVPCAAGHCSALVATTDGGHTWTLVGPVPAAFGDAGVRRVRFADAHDGWVFDPQLWATHDGGQTWREVPAPTRVADVEAWGGRAYAVMDPHLLRTSTGADAWSPVPGVDLGEGANSIVLHGSAAWIVTGGRTMVMTTDGTTWRTVATPCGSLAGGWTLAAVAPVDATDVDLLCVGNAGLGSESKQVLLSKDAGRHATPTSADPPRSGGANGIAAASPDVVVIAARSGASYLYRSADAGASWQVGVQHGDGGVGFFDLGFTTSTQGVAVYGQPDVVTHTQLLMTRDAGASWAPVSF